MRQIVLGVSLLMISAVAGCASSQVHQSLLLQENRQLEDALHVAHSQVVELKRENDWLRSKQETEVGKPLKRSYTGTVEEEFDFDIAPPFETPKVILPGQSGTEEVPESLRGSQMIPIWTPVR